MWTQVMKHTDPFLRLRRSKFRREQSLDPLEMKMVDRYGIDVMKEHAYKIVEQRIKQTIDADGKQTPKRGHPVFKAMHATSTCCRKCLFRWHRIPRYRDMTDEEVSYVVGMIVRWIRSQVFVF